ncbi:hypothetical protein VTN77DRAFT_1625 [Rasamsonia byssochlamydoides]|uniref:uncharacterized protein n=1 Tax=Rasamsonia byssochlamydoides TaxID=89139 RepID=UPI0037437C56
MDRLPSELLHELCGLIWETSTQSLHALSLVNSIFYHAAVPFLYRTLTLHVSSRERLHRVVSKLMKQPLRQKYLTHARQLTVTGKIPRLGASVTEQLVKRTTIEDSDVSHHLDDLEPYYDDMFTTDEVEDKPTEVSRAWEPLASLISRLKHLTELNYACVNQFPPCLLQALHQYHPGCRLNLHTFRFRSLRWPVTDPYETELISSPCLHSLRVRHIRRDSNWDVDYNVEAVLRAVAIAPNLKHVKLQHCISIPPPPYLRRLPRTRRQAWQDFVPPVETHRIGRLTSLSFSKRMVTTEKTLEELGRYADLSRLQAFAFGCARTPSVLMKAATMAPFGSLERLSLHLEPLQHDDDFLLATEMFFESLNPLKTLRLHGELDASLVGKVLERHGCALRELMLNFYPYTEFMVLAPADIARFGECCPLLEELHLEIKRSKGDYHETQTYKALGKFPSLKKMFLHIYCSDTWQPQLPSPDECGEELDEFERQPYDAKAQPTLYNFHIRDALINGAVDEKLARSIWDLISANQSSGCLSSLRIIPKDSGLFSLGYFIPSGLSTRAEHMSRSFWITKNAYHSSSDVEVVELDKQAREDRDEKKRQREEAKMPNKQSTWQREKLSQIFQRIWPPKPDSRDWRDDWSSWPLQMEESSQKD